MKHQEEMLNSLLIFIHKTLRDDYDRQLRPNYANPVKSNVHPLEQENKDERMALVYSRIKENTDRLQQLLEDLQQKMKQKKDEEGKL